MELKLPEILRETAQYGRNIGYMVFCLFVLVRKDMGNGDAIFC